MNTCSEDHNGKVISVIQIFRHGHKAPEKILPKDPYQIDTYFPAQIGELTLKGKRQIYDLGCYTRERYSSLLKPKYFAKDFRIYSTNRERCIQSAQLFAAGLYPPTEEEIWKEDLKWQPIPTRVADEVLFSFSPIEFCPYYSKIVTEIYRKELRPFYEQKSKFLSDMNDFVGTGRVNIYEIFHVFDSFEIEKSHGLKLPEWAEEAYPKIEEVVTNIYSYRIKTDELRKIAFGPFLKDMKDHFERMSEDASSGPKLISYAGHDINVFGFLNIIGKNATHHKPPHASSLYFELREKNGEHYVHLLYKEGDDLKPIPILGSSADSCTLADFNSTFGGIMEDKEVIRKMCSDEHLSDFGE